MTTRETLEKTGRDLANLAEKALAHAKKAGAEDAKVSGSMSLTKRLVVEGKEFTLANSLETRQVGIGVHKDRRKGSATINTIDETSLERAVDDALALARFSVPDESLTMADKDLAPPAKQLPFMWHDDLAAVDLDSLHALMKDVFAVLTRDERLALDRFEMAVTCSWHGLWNSRGVAQQEVQTMASWWFMGMARDGEQVSGFDYDGDFSYGASDMAEKAKKGAEAFARKVIGFLNPRACPSYKGAVLLTPRAVREVLTSTILFHASGRQVMDGKSRWENSLGEQVVSPLLTLIDEPHDGTFSGCTAFDRDGVPTRRQAIIQNGILETILHDCYSAKRLRTKTTASSGGPFVMKIAPGKTPLAELTKDHETLLVVDRFSGNTDPVKGDFSGVAKGSRLYRKGEDVGAVTETMIAGNVFDLAKAVIGVSLETQTPGGSFLAPYILVDGVSVTGQG